MTPETNNSSSVGVRLEETYCGVAQAYIIQVTNIQDRTGLIGTPLGVGLTIKLFIHEIAFVSIWPNQQASEYFESTRKTVQT